MSYGKGPYGAGPYQKAPEPNEWPLFAWVIFVVFAVAFCVGALMIAVHNVPTPISTTSVDELRDLSRECQATGGTPSIQEIKAESQPRPVRWIFRCH